MTTVLLTALYVSRFPNLFAAFRWLRAIVNSALRTFACSDHYPLLQTFLWMRFFLEGGGKVEESKCSTTIPCRSSVMLFAMSDLILSR